MAQRAGAPAVSVVIPAYNSARTLEATLRSVEAQTQRDFEAVVIDDGSSDSTFEMATAFAHRDRRFNVVRQSNGGVADARNAGIRHTSAPLIASLDGDDVWHPTFLEKLCRAFEEGGRETVLAYANSRIIDMSGHVLKNAPFSHHAGHVVDQLVVSNFIGNGSAMMFRREVALEVGAYDRRLHHEFGTPGCDDWLLGMRLAARGNVAVVREYLVGYRYVPGSMSEHVLRTRRSRLNALILFLRSEPRTSNTARRRALGIAYAKCFLREVLAGEPVAASRSLVTALRYDFSETCQLLFGPERWSWLIARLFPQRSRLPEFCFFDIDPREADAVPINGNSAASMAQRMHLA